MVYLFWSKDLKIQWWPKFFVQNGNFAGSKRARKLLLRGLAENTKNFAENIARF